MTFSEIWACQRRRGVPRRWSLRTGTLKGCYDDIRLSAQRRGYVAHIPHRGVAPSTRKRGQKAHRWVIERPNRWHNLFHRLKIRHEV